MRRRELLGVALEESYRRLRARLGGLTDRELFWEPGAGCWTLHPGDRDRWTYDYALPEPVPAPLTTLAWQLWHVASCKLMYHEWAFGSAQLTWPGLEVAHTTTSLIALLERGQALLRQELASLGERELDDQRLTNWGERWPTWRIFWTLADHDALHTGAIGQLRDLYRWRTEG